VTIALGFCVSDGIALCTDSEINKEGGLKYNDKKIHPLMYDDHALAFAYSGSPEIMDLLLEWGFRTMPISVPGHADHPFRADADHDSGLMPITRSGLIPIS
jgi:hypothetical protein